MELTDAYGTPFTSDDLPQEIPANLDAYGEITSVGHSPLRILLTAGSKTLGELGFAYVAGGFPGTLGALELDGISLELPDGSHLGIDSLDIYDVEDTVTLAGTRFDRDSTDAPFAIGLVVNSLEYGTGGVAKGNILCPASEVMGVEPSPFRWVVDPDSGSPEDGEAVVSYMSEPGSEVMGVEPSPFRYFVVDEENLILGEVDFSQSQGRWGSFHLEGVGVWLEDGSVIGVQSFEAFDLVDVDIDVKPGSDDNTINLGSAGVIPVAILSSSTFDATTVDPATISLSGASVKLAGNGKRYLAQPEDVNDDGLDDLMCKILTEELDIEVGDSVVVLEAVTYDGTAITGQDFIRIVPN